MRGKAVLMATTMALGERLRELRLARHMTQEQLAQAAGISPQTLLYTEKGATTPSITILLKLCGALGVSLSEFDGTTPPRDYRQTKQNEAGWADPGGRPRTPGL
jgi:transcriptional regulator with XRE-family HTH domain